MTENLSILLILCHGRALAQFGPKPIIVPDDAYWSGMDFAAAANELHAIRKLAQFLDYKLSASQQNLLLPLGPDSSIAITATYLLQRARFSEEAELRSLIDGLAAMIATFGGRRPV